MKNPKTTIYGVVGAILTVLVDLLQNGTVDYKTIVISCAIAGLGVLAKDFNTTGGTQAATDEAKNRVTPS